MFNNTNSNINNNEDYNEIEFDKNSKKIVSVINSQINSEMMRTKNKISNSKISYKSQKGNSSISNFSIITSLENLNSDSESVLNIANIRGYQQKMYKK